ncbi:hypothetical protein ANN_21641 [Periplaneta americana]|uniref:Uncharacterized protein n=1 Tax=Periplaneta americana TaxID=6978 RepID=A0ABQ8S738_PERAM|nr:hypothetical protein ANN_21641 [Periplaneta americana]
MVVKGTVRRDGRQLWRKLQSQYMHKLGILGQLWTEDGSGTGDGDNCCGKFKALVKKCDYHVSCCRIFWGSCILETGLGQEMGKSCGSNTSEEKWINWVFWDSLGDSGGEEVKNLKRTWEGVKDFKRTSGAKDFKRTSEGMKNFKRTSVKGTSEGVNDLKRNAPSLSKNWICEWIMSRGRPDWQVGIALALSFIEFFQTWVTCQFCHSPVIVCHPTLSPANVHCGPAPWHCGLRHLPRTHVTECALVRSYNLKQKHLGPRHHSQLKQKHLCQPVELLEVPSLSENKAAEMVSTSKGFVSLPFKRILKGKLQEEIEGIHAIIASL